MPELETIEIPAVKPIDKRYKATIEKLVRSVKEESQVVVHFSYTAKDDFEGIRIWKSTFLFAKDSSHVSKLVHTEKISLYPNWTSVAKGETLHFTLLFTGLPKHCKRFDLLEKIPQSGGFYVKDIIRNDSDVYSIDLNSHI